jgi:hypothetical protein
LQEEAATHEERLKWIRAFSPSLAERLRAERFQSEHVRTIHDAMQAAIRARHAPQGLANTIGWWLDAEQRYGVSRERIAAALPIFVEEERSGRPGIHGGDFANALRHGLDWKVLKPEHLDVIVPHLLATARNGHRASALSWFVTDALKHELIGPAELEEFTRFARKAVEASQGRPDWLNDLLEGVKLGALNRAHVEAMAPLLAEAAAQGHDARELASKLQAALKPSRFFRIRPIKTPEDFKRVCDHLKLAWTGKQKSAPASLLFHALAANRKLGDWEKTLALQRLIIENGNFPTAKLTLLLAKAKPKSK